MNGDFLQAIKPKEPRRPVQESGHIEFTHYVDIRQTKPCMTIENVEKLMNHLGVVARYNVITKRVELIVPGFEYTPDNHEELAMIWLESKMREYRFEAIRESGAIVDLLANKNYYNPMKEWIESADWDGTPRLRQLYDSVIVDRNNSHKEFLIRKWMIQAVKAVYVPEGIRARGLLVFQSKQHRGKTLWFKSLFPAPVDVYAKTGVTLNPTNRDSCMAALSHFACELGEIDAIFRKTDIAALKSFLSEGTDVWRLSYGRREKHFPRRTVFYASVNDEQFLVDNTGNTRFWTVPIISCNEKHGLDMQQVWAEVTHLFRNGADADLDEGELNNINTVNADFLMIEPMEDLIATKYDWDSKIFRRWLSVSEIAHESGLKQINKMELSKIATAVKRFNGGLSKRGSYANLFAVPELKQASLHGLPLTDTDF